MYILFFFYFLLTEEKIDAIHYLYLLHSFKILRANKSTFDEEELSKYMNMINIANLQDIQDMQGETNINKEEYNLYIPEKVEEIINKKMHVIVDDSYKSDKTLEEYDKELYDLSTKIIYGNYDIILGKLLKKYEEYFMELSMCYNLENVYVMYKILTNEYCKFLKCYMNYDVEKKEYGEDCNEFKVCAMNNRKKKERKKYKNLTITIPAYVPQYKFNRISRRKSKNFFEEY
jgi:hypothetical protein